MALDTLAVYTRDNADEIILKGYCGDWRIDAQGIPGIKYLMVVSQNPEDRGCVRVLAQVTRVEKVEYEGSRPRYRFHFDKFTRPNGHISWKSTSPIRYFDSTLLPYSVNHDYWDTVRNARTVKVQKYAAVIAHDLGVSEDKVTITVDLG